jgi:hypothetical protein
MEYCDFGVTVVLDVIERDVEETLGLYYMEHYMTMMHSEAEIRNIRFQNHRVCQRHEFVPLKFEMHVITILSNPICLGFGVCPLLPCYYIQNSSNRSVYS